MVVLISVLLVLAVWLASRGKVRPLDRSERMGLEAYDRKARCEASYPFDCSSR